MTNKTIIDGIDVSECKYLTSANGCDCTDTTSFECCRVDNCFFKQLARAKDEIEKLRKLQDDLVIENEKLKSELSETIGAIDNIRKSKEHWQKVSITDSQDVERLSEEIEKWKHQAELGSDTTDRLSKELEEKEQEIEKLKSQLQTLDDETVTVQLTQEEYEGLKAKEQECNRLKEKQKELLHDCNSCKFHQYKQALENIEAIVSGNYDTLDPLAKQYILEIIKQAKDGE